jgi:hypothetical protein
MRVGIGELEVEERRHERTGELEGRDVAGRALRCRMEECDDARGWGE